MYRMFRMIARMPRMLKRAAGLSVILVPSNAMLYEDGTPMLYEDGTFMLYEA